MLKLTAENCFKYSFLVAFFALPFEEISATVFFVVAAVTGVIICIREKTFPVRRGLLLLIALFIVSIIISFRYTPDIGYSIMTFFWTIFRYLFVAFTGALYVRRNGWSSIVVAGVAAAVISCIYGVVDVIVHPFVENKEWIDAEKFASIPFRLFGTWDNPNIFGGYMLFAITLAASGTLNNERRYKNRLYIAATGLFVVCEILTFSRGVWLAMFALLFMLGWLKYHKKVLWLLLPLAVVFSTFSVLWRRLESVFLANDSSSVMRIALWTSTAKMIHEHPWFGWGWGLYWFYYPRYDYLLQSAGLKVYHAHNTFLHYAAEIGFTGLAVFLAILVISIYYSFIDKDKHSTTPAACGMLLIAFSILLFTDHVLFNTRMSMMFWLFIGGLAVNYGRSNDAGENR